MKHLLLFIHNLPILRPKNIFLQKAIVCSSNTCNYKQLMSVKEYVIWATQISKEKIKALLFTSYYYIGANPFARELFFDIFQMLFLRVYNTAIQQITSDKAIVFNSCFSLFNSPEPFSPGQDYRHPGHLQ